MNDGSITSGDRNDGRQPRPIEYLLAESIAFLGRNTLLAVGLALGLLLSFGFSLTNFSISIDEELHLASDQNSAWMRQGRLAITLEKWLFNTVYPLPFLNVALSIILIFLSAIVWMAFFERMSRGRLTASPAALLTALFYATLPVNGYYLSFNTYNVEVSLGLVFAAISARAAWLWAVDRSGWRFFVAALASSFLTASTYQSLLFVIIAGLLLAQAADLLTAEAPAPRRLHLGPVGNLWVLAPILAGVGLSIAMTKFVLPSESYTEGFFAWGTLPQQFVVMRLKDYILDTANGASLVGGQAVAMTTAAGVLLLLLALLRSARTWDLTVPVLVLGLFCLPFVLSVALGTPMPYRAQQSFPLAFGGFWMLLYLIVPWRKALRPPLFLLALLVLVWNAEANTRLSLTEYIAFERDKALGHQIAGALSAQGWAGTVIPLVIVGTPSHPADRFSIPSETMGRSLFEWDHGSRAPIFLGILGYPFTHGSTEQIEAAFKFAAGMPIWPLPGSTSLHDGVAIVHFGTPE